MDAFKVVVEQSNLIIDYQCISDEWKEDLYSDYMAKG